MILVLLNMSLESSLVSMVPQKKGTGKSYQEAKDLVTFSSKDLANRVVDGDKPLYLTALLGASRIKWALVDIGASTNILPLPTFDALGISRERIIPEPFQVAGIGSLQ